MTKCGKANLKSSVYNPNGQSYFTQLSTYNSMTSHIRRVLLAKSVVDSKNERYMRFKQHSESRCVNKKKIQDCPPCDIIDRLAYDTEHHPADIVRSSCTASKVCNQGHRSPCQQGPKTLMKCCRNCSKSRSHSHSPYRKPDCLHHQKQKKQLTCNKEITFSNKSDDIKKYKNVNLDQSSYVSNFECPSNEMASNYASTDSSSHLSDNESNDPKCLQSNILIPSAEKEEALYAQFVYDITQDIIRKGLYTDTEFQQVFKKHLERNSGVLDKHRMLYEIYQLKISLNMDEEDEEDDEENEKIANYIYSHRFPKMSEPKPPTPPKVLDENKVVQKLKSHRKLIENCKMPRTTSCKSKSVVLVDANPEVLVTERDILQTLMEANMDPTQAERICRSLFHKSKDTSLCQMVMESIFDHSSNIQKTKKKQETTFKSFTKKRNSHITTNDEENTVQMENVQKMEIKNATTNFALTGSNEVKEPNKEKPDNDYSSMFDHKFDEEVNWIHSNILKMKELKIAQNEENEHKSDLSVKYHDVDQDKIENEIKIVSENEESEIEATYSKDFFENSKSEQNESGIMKEEINTASNIQSINEDTSAQLSEYIDDDLKDLVSEIVSKKEEKSEVSESI